MTRQSLTRVWLLLMGLSGVGTALSLVGGDQTAPWLVTLGIFGVAWAKARLILLHYLGLANTPHWRGGMMAVITFALLLFAGLWLAG